MTSKAKKLFDEALRLPPAEREALASELFDSLEKDDPDAEPLWEMEVETRIAELEKGTVKPILWAEAKRMIFEDMDEPG